MVKVMRINTMDISSLPHYFGWIPMIVPEQARRMNRDGSERGSPWLKALLVISVIWAFLHIREILLPIRNPAQEVHKLPIQQLIEKGRVRLADKESVQITCRVGTKWIVIRLSDRDLQALSLETSLGDLEELLRANALCRDLQEAGFTCHWHNQWLMICTADLDRIIRAARAILEEVLLVPSARPLEATID